MTGMLLGTLLCASTDKTATSLNQRGRFEAEPARQAKVERNAELFPDRYTESYPPIQPGNITGPVETSPKAIERASSGISRTTNRS